MDKIVLNIDDTYNIYQPRESSTCTCFAICEIWHVHINWQLSQKFFETVLNLAHWNWFVYSVDLINRMTIEYGYRCGALYGAAYRTFQWHDFIYVSQPKVIQVETMVLVIMHCSNSSIYRRFIHSAFVLIELLLFFFSRGIFLHSLSVSVSVSSSLSAHKYIQMNLLKLLIKMLRWQIKYTTGIFVLKTVQAPNR